MPFTISRIPLNAMPDARGSARWGHLRDEVIAAQTTGEAVQVEPFTPDEASNFAQYMRTKGWKVMRRRIGEGFVLTVERIA